MVVKHVPWRKISKEGGGSDQVREFNQDGQIRPLRKCRDFPGGPVVESVL